MERDEQIQKAQQAMKEAEQSIAEIDAVGTVHRDERGTFTDVAAFLTKELAQLQKHFQSLLDEEFSDDWDTEYLAFEGHFNSFSDTLQDELEAARQAAKK